MRPPPKKKIAPKGLGDYGKLPTRAKKKEGGRREGDNNINNNGNNLRSGDKAPGNFSQIAAVCLQCF